MSKQLKALITDTLKSRFDGVDEACVVDIIGLNVEENQKVRNSLRDKNISVMVVKNSLARRAFTGGPLEPLGNDLKGCCALVTGGDSIIDAARAIAELAKDFPKLGMKNALLSGELDLISVADLAKMKGRIELLGEIAMLVSSPGRSIAGCIGSPAGKIAGCLKTMADKNES